MLRRFVIPIASLHSKRSASSYVHGATSEKLRFETTGEVFRNAVERNPDKEFLVFASQNIRKSFHDVYNDARKLAGGLIALGLQKGDRVGIWGPNYYEWTVVQFATAMAGMIQVNINPAYTPNELHYALNTVGVKALITPEKFGSKNYIEILNEVSPISSNSRHGVGAIQSQELPHLAHLLVFGNESSIRGAWNLEEVWNGAETRDFHELEQNEQRILPDDPVNIQYTSGTTGSPKAATLTHHNIVNNAWFTGLRSGWDKTDHRICIPNPLYHCFGCVIGVMNALCHTQTCVFPAVNYNIRKTIETIEKERCTYIFGTPTMFIDLLSSPLLKLHDTSRVVGGYIAGAPCPQALCEAMQRDLGMTELHVLYGSTELSPIVTMTRAEIPHNERSKSVGHVCPNVEICIVDQDGKCVPRGQKGELLARGYMTMRGYWGDMDRTNKDITPDRWYHTGQFHIFSTAERVVSRDTAVMNEDESICIVGRTKDMICRGGENIYPTEIEQVIFKFPFVADVQVIGVPDDRLGEAVCAWVRVKPEFKDKVTDEMIKDACKGKMSSFKIPRYILIKEETDFPLTATGKVKKYALREISRKLLGLEKTQPHLASMAA